MRVLGVDGCPGGWVGAQLDLDGTTPGDLRFVFCRDARELLTLARTAAATAVDMPMGLPAEAPRAADRAARRLLGARRASVFPAPPRVILQAQDYRQACALARATTGTAVTLQAWHLVAKIRDLDALLSPQLQSVLVEAHPELSFTLLCGAPMALPKTRAAGRELRRRALAGWLGQDPLALAGPGRPDDRLDALACAWTAVRVATGGALVLPDRPERDERGLLMQIVG